MTKQAKIERAATEQLMTAPKTTPETTSETRPTTAPAAGNSSSGAMTFAAASGGAGMRLSVDRSAAARGGSIFLVLLVAAMLVAAATGIVLVGGGNAEPYIMAFLAVLATVGVFSLFALACGIIRVSGGATAQPLVKAIVDGASEGTVVTDHDGRVIYA